MSEYLTLTFSESFWKEHEHHMNVTEEDIQKADPNSGYIKTVGNGYNGQCKLHVQKLMPQYE